MEPAKLDDRELACIDFFLFCFLLSSGLVWAPSWAILASSWLILAHLGFVWAHLGSISGHLGSILGHVASILDPSWLHLEPSWLPKASPDHPKISFGAQRLPRANIAFFEHPMNKLSRESFDPEQTLARILLEKCASLSTPFS